METMYGIYNTAEKQFVSFLSHGAQKHPDGGDVWIAKNVPGTNYSGTYVYVTPDKNVAEAECQRINSAFKPQYRFNTVVTVTIGD